MLYGLDALRRDNPWPERLHAEPFYLSLDGGGRHLVTSAIREHDVTLMIEVGSFLCGSTLQWLDASTDLTVIGVDPWDGNWGPYVRGMTDPAGLGRLATALDVEHLGELIEAHGNYAVALNNVRAYGDRFIPVRRFSPEALHYLHSRGVEPGLVYIDAFKEVDDLAAANQLFPNAVLCGDDWSWRDESGSLRMQDHVTNFATERGLEVQAIGATWILTSARF